MSSTELMDDKDDEAIAVMEGPGSFAVAATEVDVQIATAHRFPRNIKAFKQQALALATLDEETAQSCFYCLPRGGKKIVGPSARLAEIVASSWGNIRAEARVVETTDTQVVSEALCWDLEKNVAIRVQVRRRITDSRGNRYNEDMVVVTGNAASSIALRNAVFKVIPAALTKSVYEAARKVAVGDAKSLVDRRNKMVETFSKIGVTVEQVCAVVGKPSIDDVDLEDLAVLIGIFTAIKEGDTTIEQAFSVNNTKKGATTTIDELSKKKAESEAKKKAASPKEKEEPAKEPKEGMYGDEPNAYGSGH